jgi:hypothetical protein
MKFKVRLQELEVKDSETEVLNEWIDDAFKTLIKLGSGSTMLKSAGRMIRGGIPLSKKADDVVAAAVNLLPQSLVKNISDAAIAAANKAAEAGEAVIFQTKVGNTEDGRNIFMVFSAGPDGIQSVKTYEGIAGRKGELAALGREADKIIKGSDDAIPAGARAGDEVVDAGEEAAETAARQAEKQRKTDALEDTLTTRQEQIDAFVSSGKVVKIDDSAKLQALFKKNAKGLWNDAVEAGFVKSPHDEDITIPLTVFGKDVDGNMVRKVVTDGADRVIMVRVPKGKITPTMVRGVPAGDADLYYKAIIKAIDVADNKIAADLDTLPAIWRRARREGKWLDAGIEVLTSLKKRGAEEVSNWYMPIRYLDKWKKTKLGLIALDIGIGGGFVKIFPAFGSAILRFLGIARKVGGLGTSSWATGIYIIQGLGFIVSWYYLITNYFGAVEEQEEEAYKKAVNSPDSNDKFNYLSIMKQFFEKNNINYTKPPASITMGDLQDLVEEYHRTYLDATIVARGESFREYAANVADDPMAAVGYPGDVWDVLKSGVESSRKSTDIEPDELKAGKAEEGDLKAALYDMIDKGGEALRSLSKRMTLDEDKAKADSKKFSVVGERKPKKGSEIEPKAPGIPSGDSKKADFTDDDKGLGDLSGIDDSLFEIFNTGKPISIKVKSSSPRVRAKITEKK